MKILFKARQRKIAFEKIVQRTSFLERISVQSVNVNLVSQDNYYLLTLLRIK